MDIVRYFVRGAEDARYLTSGHAQAHPVALDTRLPASYGPEVRYPRPSAAPLWRKRENTGNLTKALVSPVTSANKFGQCLTEFLH